MPPAPTCAGSGNGARIPRARKTPPTLALPLLLCALFLIAGCASTPERSLPASEYEAAGTWKESGTASWYGAKYAGHPTASGRIFNPSELTAAHKTLPFGSIVEVRNPANGRRVIVEITDRGPFVKGRIIDLSEEAARRIGIIGPGIAPVEIRLLRRKR